MSAPDDSDRPEDSAAGRPGPRFDPSAWPNGWHDFLSCSAKGIATLSVQTTDWAGHVALFIGQTDQYGPYPAHTEQHTLLEVSRSPTGGPTGWTKLVRALHTRALVTDQAPNKSTMWACGDQPFTLDPSSAHAEAAFALAVWAEWQSPSEPPTDCITFGHAPTELRDDAYTGGTCVDGAQRVYPSWYDPARCPILP